MDSNTAHIVDRALEEIRPASGQEAACRTEIEVASRQLNLLHDYFQGWLSPGVLKQRMSRLAGSLRTTIKLIKSLPTTDRELVFRGLSKHTARIDPETLLAHLESLAQRLALLTDSLNVPKGAQHLPPVKLFAAHYAHELLRRFANKSPTLSAEGPYLSLACILHEGATGEENGDMRRACEP